MDYINNLINTLSTQVGTLLPTLFGALVALIIGFLVASGVKRLIRKLFSKTKLDEQIAEKINIKFRVDEFVSKIIYYLIVLFTILVVLNILGVDTVLDSLNGMMKKILAFLPKIVLGGFIAYAGYILAKILSEAGGALASGLEAFSEKNGISTGSISLAKLLKQIIFIFIFIPILIIAFDTLEMEAISNPASEMLASFMSAVPKIIAAGILLAVFYVAGRYLVGIVTDLLKNLGLDKFANEIGISQVLGNMSFSKLIGNIAMFFILFTGIIAAFDKLEITEISAILSTIFAISGKIFFGLVILLAGTFVSNLAVKAVNQSEYKWLASVIRFATMGIFLALSLHTMGIAENIVELTFGLTLGSIAVAFALAFGLGGREAAGKQLDHFFSKIRSNSSKNSDK